MGWRIAIDTGGTFTDVVALDETSGNEWVFKTSSTPSDPSVAFQRGVSGILSQVNAPTSSIQASSVAMIFHGTTVATNAILQANYARIGLIVTEGFRDILEVARQTVPGDFGAITYWIKPPRVVPLEYVREISGRLNYQGKEIRPLDEEQIRDTAAEFRELGIDAIAVALLHSYRNPYQEQRVQQTIKSVFPECFVSISSDVIREYREYERTLSTCLNTGLMPLFSTYIDRLTQRLADVQVRAPLYIMKSSGGVTGSAEMVSTPISAGLSGPAAGILGACAIAEAAGMPDVLTLDMGGTSTDIALIQDGTATLLTEGRIDIYDVKAPMIDMTTIGAGGGSIAWISASHALRVGPKSAGADPGPVCYGKGGTEPTVTDANLILGRISPYLLGGDIVLDLEAAKAAVTRVVAEPLGLSLEKAADGILQIATTNIASAVRLVSVQRGRDPRMYGLFSFGGAGGLLACHVADELGMTKILIPRSPGATSAEGLLFADVRVDEVITEVQREDSLDVDKLNDEYQDLGQRAIKQLQQQGFSADRIRISVFLDIRYVDQAYEIRVNVEGANGKLDREDLMKALDAFHSAHDDRYGYSYRGTKLCEIVNVGVTGFGVFARPPLRAQSPSSTWDRFFKGERTIYSRQRDEMIPCKIYDRPAEPVGDVLRGPVVIEQYDSTTVVDEGWQAQTNAYGHLFLSRGEESTRYGS